MRMSTQDIWINRVGMAAIVLVSMGYVLFGSTFAQMRLEFSFLNFPVFIGEILFCFSLLLLIFKIVLGKQELGRWGWILGAYFLFILVSEKNIHVIIICFIFCLKVMGTSSNSLR